jgi:predicted CXXCH cytochrome family protein
MRTILGFRCCTALLVAGVLYGQDEGRIMRPADLSAHAAGEIDIVAKAPAGKLELDGQVMEAAEPFPNVYHAKVTPSAGEHTLAIVWESGRKEVRFFVGDNAPAEFKAFQHHPPVPGVQCTQCHGISSRGRFRFKGGCFDCHQKEKQAFVEIHAHPEYTFVECGTCHNAHGSTAAKHLIYPKEIMCKLCHN